jgi:hypothetical protein
MTRVTSRSASISPAESQRGRRRVLTIGVEQRDLAVDGDLHSPVEERVGVLAGPRLLSFGYGGLSIVSHICSVVAKR